MHKSSSLSIQSLCTASWDIYKVHWKVLLSASMVPFVVSLLQRFFFDGADAISSIVALLALVTGFVSYVYQTMYIIELKKGNAPHWKDLIFTISLGKVWRIVRTNIWMVFIIVWPMFLIVAVAGVAGYLLGQNSFTGTTISLIAMGIAAVVGAILSFIRSLSYTLMLYLAFTTNKRVRVLHKVSKDYMRGNRIKLLKIVLLQMLAGVVAALTVVLLPVVQSFVYIVMVLFAHRVIEKSHQSESSVDSTDDITVVPVTDVDATEERVII